MSDSKKKQHKSDNNAMVANWEIEGDRDILENIRVKNFFKKVSFMLLVIMKRKSFKLPELRQSHGVKDETTIRGKSRGCKR